MEVDLRKPPISTPNSDVEDQVKGLIEGRVEVSRPAPWIEQKGVVLLLGGEVASLPEAFLPFEGDVENLLCEHQQTPNEKP